MKNFTFSVPQEVVFGNGSLAQLPELLHRCRSDRVLLISDRMLEKLGLVKRISDLAEAAGVQLSAFLDVEANPSVQTVEKAAAAYRGFGATSIIALGGGVVGDITGFAAATFLRGVSLCQIPTTLLAQVDSSVGGKTGVDMPEGKNLVGAFYQPRLVLIDPAVLATLPDQTFADGMAEVVKYGYISNREILDMVSAPDYKKNIERIICECVRIKRDVVTIDEHDTGLRMILNFGHTIGHAAEKLGNYVDLTHGQAVAVGMVAAMRLSAMLGNEDLSERLIGILEHIGLPTELKYGREDIYRSLLSDKKKFGATVNFILVREPGRAEITPIGAEKLHEYVLKL